MKRFYSSMLALACLTLTVGASAQVSQLQKRDMNYPLTSAVSDKSSDSILPSAKGSETTFFSEDFSNGFDGQGANGAWTIDGDQGDLWYMAFPTGASGGYDPAAAILDGTSIPYGTKVPNYFGTRTADGFAPTEANGFMMMDADRWNSTSVVGTPGTLTQNAINSVLVSPVMDLSAAGSGAQVVFSQYVRQCCTAANTVFLGVSFDGGATYVNFDVRTPYGAINADIRQEVVLCLNELFTSAPALDNVRFRFEWNSTNSHYFWMVDDFAVISPPANDLVIGDVFFDRYFLAVDEENTAEEYYDTFEWQNTPDYLMKPVHFHARAINECSQNPQTNISLSVTITAPNSATETVTSVQNLASLATGEEGVVFTEPVDLVALFGGTPLVGQYTFDYVVSQDEVDDRPENNVGDQRGMVVSNDADNDGFAIMQNAGLTYNGAFTQVQFSQDALWSNAFVFEEPTITNSVITHVEAVFLNSLDFAETQPGEVVYFNVRDGAILDEDPEDESTITGVFFDSENPLEYDDPSLEFTITAEDLWAPADGFPQNWVSFELPSPILIETNRVYGAEFRIPPAGEGIVFPPVSTVRCEDFGTLFNNFSGDAPGWGAGADGATASIRFRTSSANSVDKVTYDSGVKLTQNWPNPFSSETRFMFQLDETSTVRFELHDIQGRLVMADNLGLRAAAVANTYVMPRKNLAPGVYTYSIVTENSRVTRKLTIE